MKLYYTTFPDQDELERISVLLLDERLAACVNSFSVDSMYRWEGKMERDGEVGAFFKTSDRNAKDFVARLEEEHPYDVPEILEIPVSANQAYEEWVDEETR